MHRNVSCIAVLIGAFGLASSAVASSHREAPDIAKDQFADNTDVYAFISPEAAGDDPLTPEADDELVVIANFVPLLKPDSGPNFYGFDDKVRYSVHLDNDGDAADDVRYDFYFKTTIANPGTFLYNTGPVASIDDPNLNVRQTYDVYRVERTRFFERSRRIVRDAPVAPWYVGANSFVDDATYEGVARQAITTEGGVKVFAGPRDEGFFVDLGVFDLLGVGGTGSTDGLNVMTIAIQLPIDDIVDGERPAATVEADDPRQLIGVHASASRKRSLSFSRLISPVASGSWRQVSRLGLPLVNEVLIPLSDKDRFNRLDPVNDAANFGGFITSGDLASLIESVLGPGLCAVGAAGENPFGPPASAIVDLISPNGSVPADLLRINIKEGEVAANSAFPNGRALEDDVVETLLSFFCLGMTTGLDDGVLANDRAFTDEFPHLATPFSGNP